MQHLATIIAICIISLSTKAQEPLSGTLIYDSSASETSAIKAFDGLLEGGFMSTSTNKHPWVGLDLGEPHVISRVGWAPFTGFEKESLLGVFEGANSADFIDAIPLYIVSNTEEAGNLHYAEVPVTRAFRYVRYVGSKIEESYCGRIAELAFFGEASNGSDSLFYQPTNLPLVVMHTVSGNDPEDKFTNIDAICSVIYRSKKGISKIVGDTCTTRGRGNASWKYFPKRPYRVKFNHKVDMPAGGDKAKKWTLITNYGDKSLMRNLLGYEVSRRLEMEYTPYCQAVDFVLNGSYLGNYQLCDLMEISKNRLNINEMTATDVSGEALTGSYLYEYDGNRYDKYTNYYQSPTTWAHLTAEQQGLYDMGFMTAKNNPVTIKSPDEDKMQQVQFDYLKNYLNDVAENKVYAQADDLTDIYDAESFAKFFIVSEFTGNTDILFEVYQYKKRGDDRIYSGPCWDLDLTFDNDSRTHSYFMDSEASTWSFEKVDDVSNGAAIIEDYRSFGNMRGFAQSMLANEVIQQALQENWAYVRSDGRINSDTLICLVDELEDSLMQSQELNFKRWQILNTLVHQNYQALGNYADEVNTIRTYIPLRLNFFDRMLHLNPSSFEFDISCDEYATMYVPFAFKVPEPMEFFSIDDVDEQNQLLVSPVLTVRPNKPYLVHAPAGHYVVEGNEVTGIDNNTLGLLTGALVDRYAPMGSYVLQNIGGSLAFYRVASKGVVMPANRAFLTLPSEKAASRFINLPFEDTGIREIQMEEEPNIWTVYNLSGVMLLSLEHKPQTEELKDKLQSGVYLIVHGKIKTKISL